MYTGTRRNLARIRPSPYWAVISYVPRIRFISIEALTRPFVQAVYFCRFERSSSTPKSRKLNISKALDPNGKPLPENYASFAPP